MDMDGITITTNKQPAWRITCTTVWQNIKDSPPPVYDWLLFGCIYDGNMVWQIGRVLNSGTIEFWDDQVSGPYAGNVFLAFTPEMATHWLKIPDLLSDHLRQNE